MIKPTEVFTPRTIRDVMMCLGPSDPDWSELKKWPPNVFALTSTLLLESGACRLAVDPPPKKDWPPEPDFWTKDFSRDAAEWRKYAGDPKGNEPAAFKQHWDTLTKSAGRTSKVGGQDPELKVPELSDPANWEACKAVLTLHAMADEACRGVGVPTGWPMSTPEELKFSGQAYILLSRNGTLSNINPDLIRVLPKLRTPQVGVTLRSLSHHLTVSTSEVAINWLLVHSGLDPERETINLMLFPVPYKTKPTDFKPWRRIPFFFYDPDDPRQQFDVKRILDLIAEGRKKVGQIDMAVFPETSLSEEDMEKLLEKIKQQNDPPIILAGVRKPASANELGLNYAEFAVLIPGEETVYRRKQHKLHRWCLDDSQIRQYHLGSVLDPNYRWWEAISIEKRELNFIPLTDAITLCPLICEDLARQEPAAEVVRAVGPTLIIALLLDGPQLSARWPSHYATVFADDPGSSVLTLTSLGMGFRSRPPGKNPSRIIALWKDKKTGLQEIPLDPGNDAVILSISRQWEEEWTADKRSDDGSAATPFLTGIEQIGLG